MYIYVYNNTYQVYSNTYNTCDGYIYIYIMYMLYYIPLILYNQIVHSRQVPLSRQVCPRQKLCAFYHHRHEKRPTPQDREANGGVTALPERDLMIGYYDIVYHSLP